MSITKKISTLQVRDKGEKKAKFEANEEKKLLSGNCISFPQITFWAIAKRNLKSTGVKTRYKLNFGESLGRFSFRLEICKIGWRSIFCWWRAEDLKLKEVKRKSFKLSVMIKAFSSVISPSLITNICSAYTTFYFLNIQFLLKFYFLKDKNTHRQLIYDWGPNSPLMLTFSIRHERNFS